MRNHNGRAITQSAGSLEQLERQLAAWRRTHRAPSPIPEALWARAAELAVQHGVCRVARTLRLNYAVLKRRTKAPSEKPAAAMATFIELLPPMAGGIGECVLEVESNRGGRLRIAMKNVAPLELASIIRDFAG